jgi:hypothetical protein
MARKTGQIIRRGSSTWLVRMYIGRDPDTRKRVYIAKTNRHRGESHLSSPATPPDKRVRIRRFGGLS